jgi:3-oxoacyl-[acyl-carrier-protein] synthase-3
VGILGTGLWEGEPVGNDAFPEIIPHAPAVDPFRGRRRDDGIVAIAGLELAPPRFARTIAAVERAFADPFRGTRRRRRFPPDLCISDAEVDAARRALDAAGLRPADVDALFVQSFLPDQIQPDNAPLVAHKLGIRHAPAWSVNSICSSAVSQAHASAAMIASGQARHVLCVHSVPYSRLSDSSASGTLQDGDMAAAFVVGPSPGSSMSFAWRTDGRLHAAIRLGWTARNPATRRYWEPSHERLMIQWNEALQPEVMGELERYATIVCGEALGRAGIRVDEIELFVSHQPMSWYAAFLDDVLGLRDGITYTSFEEYGSINACSVTASLHEAGCAGRLRRGRQMLVFTPGAGYTYAAMALVW